MKKILFTALLFFFYSTMLKAQSPETEEQGVDLLKAPASPAAQLLNIAPNTIESPTDLTSFWISVSNATDGLAKFPTNYALDLSPASLFSGKAVTLKDLNSTKTGDVMWQSFVVSAGIRQQEDSVSNISFYKTAIGIKFSIFRPKWSKATDDKFNELIKMQREVTKDVNVSVEEVENDARYKRLIKKRDAIDDDSSAAAIELDEKIQDLRLSLLAEKRTERIARKSDFYTKLKSKARDFSIERVGPFLDFAGGFSVRFPTNELNYALGDYSGAWLTGGYEGGNNKLSILGILRYLYQPEKIFADPSGTIPTKNISTFDMGSRLLYSSKNNQFTFSFESVYRSVLSSSIIKPSWRLNFSTEYDLGFNKKISLTFGRDFDGVVTKGGNLITALNFITGFGNKKKLE